MKRSDAESSCVDKGQSMTAITISVAQHNLSQLISEVNEGSEPVIIVNDCGKNAVLLSQDDWASIQETLYLHSIPGLAESIIKAGQESLSECTAYDPDEEW